MSSSKTKTSEKFLIYGKHPVLSALNNKKRICKKLYTTKDIWEEIKSKIYHSNVNLSLQKPQEINALFPSSVNHQNIVLEASPLNPLAIEDIINQDKNSTHSCIIILDQVTDPHNIGAIIRSAAAFAASAVILPINNSPKENSTIIKCAAGTYETIPLIHVTNIVNSIKLLKEYGYWIFGFDGNTPTRLDTKIFANKTVFIMGSEDTGMRKLTKENCDYLVKIPMSPSSESLNVSNAAAIALYEFAKFSSISN